MTESDVPELIDDIAAELKLDETRRNVLLATGARTPEQLLSVLRTSPSLAKRGLVNTALVSEVLSRRGGDAFRAFAAQTSEILAHASRFVFGANAPADAPWQLREEAPGFEEVIAKRAKVEAPKGTIDVRKCLPWPVRDQQLRGTCVAFAVTALREALDCEIKGGIEDLSEQFLYWAIKSTPGEPWPTQDGSTIGFGVAGLRDSGICPEPEWPYNPYPVAGNPGQGDATHPSPSAVQSAASRRREAAVYQHGTRGGSAQPVRQALERGRPVAVSLPVFRDPAAVPSVNNWTGPEGIRRGWVEDPQDGMLVDGGHAVCLTGYHEDPDAPGGGYFVIRNSWGTAWGYDLPSPGSAAPEPGYGQVSAWYVDQFLREFAQL